MNIKPLLGDVRRCTICADLPLGPRPLLQVDPAARILIAGQAPGRRAHESGVPFDDPSGDRLRSWLGVDRQVFYDASRIALLPMGFCFPGSGARGDLPPRKECADAWRDKLLATMPNVRLTILIGSYSQRWHLGKRGAKTLAENVANWKALWPLTVPLPHPSPRNRRWLIDHPQVEQTLIPALKNRVRTLLEAGETSRHS